MLSAEPLISPTGALHHGSLSLENATLPFAANARLQEMSIKVTIKPSGNPRKKLDAVIEDLGRTRIVSFGQKGAADFTTHNNPERKDRYMARHRPRENWNNPHTAGFWAAHVLWNKSSKAASVRDIERRFPGLVVSLR